MNVYVYSTKSSRYNKKLNDYIINELIKIYKNIDVFSYDEFKNICNTITIKNLIISGGDGVLHNVINLVKDNINEIVFGFIPTGTANDFLSNNNIKDIDEAINVIKINIIKEHQLVKLNDKLVLYGISVGPMSKVSTSAFKEEKVIFHKLIYKLRGIRYLFSKLEKIIIDDSDNKTEIKAKAILIIKSKYLGGVRICNKTPDTFKIIIIRNIFDVIKLFIFGRFKTLDNYNLLKQYESKIYSKLYIESNSTWCLDGELIDINKGVIEVSDKKIRMLSKNT